MAGSAQSSSSRPGSTGKHTNSQSRWTNERGPFTHEQRLPPCGAGRSQALLRPDGTASGTGHVTGETIHPHWSPLACLPPTQGVRPAGGWPCGGSQVAEPLSPLRSPQAGGLVNLRGTQRAWPADHRKNETNCGLRLKSGGWISHSSELTEKKGESGILRKQLRLQGCELLLGECSLVAE